MRTALRGRFASKRIYTHVNNLLVAVNPYEELPLYGIDVLHSYTQYGEKSPAPHVFGVGAATYRGLLDARSQSVIISGESGAGKTESAKKFLQYLAYAATLGGGVTTAEAKLEQRVIATSPLMEAFGNAQTVMNNNSSRYGKFLMLQFDLSGKIMGASIKTYLLEKVRIVARGPGERNYHMFYYLATGAPRARRAATAPRRGRYHFYGSYLRLSSHAGGRARGGEGDWRRLRGRCGGGHHEEVRHQRRRRLPSQRVRRAAAPPQTPAALPSTSVASERAAGFPHARLRLLRRQRAQEGAGRCPAPSPLPLRPATSASPLARPLPAHRLHHN